MANKIILRPQRQNKVILKLSGKPGPQGQDGKSLLSGNGVPSAGLGNNDDFYIDKINHLLYGPKTLGSWGVGFSLVGPTGSAGSNGSNGQDGRTILNGSGAPSNSLGANGDFYLDTTNSRLYGPKSAGSWSGFVSLIGPQGVQGVPGNDGISGQDGKTVRSGSGVPSSGLGVDGDFYIDNTNKVIYGPKTSGAWGSGTSLVGPQGVQGNNGATGSNGLDGRTVLNGTNAPSNALGSDGDFYLEITNSRLYGPKTSGVWSGYVSLIGPAGSSGSPGSAGADGKTVRNGVGAPSGGLGVDGDFYIDNTNKVIYGPKTSGAWGSGTSIIGPAGATGSNGSNGLDGKTIRNGSGTPSNGLGVDGDFYIDTTNNLIYGPKSAGVWGSGISIVGPAGSSGSNGQDGKTVRNGSGVPSSGLGVDGDFYIDNTNKIIYGPKTSGAWGSGYSLVGPAGTNGTNGSNGLDGKTIRNGSGVPSSGLGVDGDFYIDTTNKLIYGPKTSGAWGSGTSLVGQQGNQGLPGNDGKTILNGSGTPSNALGANGDFYLDTTNSRLYGPKSAGSWSGFVSLIGPQGNPGSTGATGSNGLDGKTVRNGSGIPSSGLGVDGDFYIDTSSYLIYGPKTSGAWGSSTSLVGPQGPAGSGGGGGSGGTGVDLNMTNSTLIRYIPDSMGSGVNILSEGANFVTGLNFLTKVGNTYHSSNFEGISSADYGHILGSLIQVGSTNQYLTTNRAIVDRGNASGIGGFKMVFFGGPDLIIANQNIGFIGLTKYTGSNWFSTQANTVFDNMPAGIGFGWQTGDSNIQVFHRGTGSYVKYNLGSNFPVSSYKYYKFEIIATNDTNRSVITCKITNIFTGNTSSVDFSTDIPATTDKLNPYIAMSSVNSSAQYMNFVKLIILNNYSSTTEGSSGGSGGSSVVIKSQQLNLGSTMKDYFTVVVTDSDVNTTKKISSILYTPVADEPDESADEDEFLSLNFTIKSIGTGTFTIGIKGSANFNGYKTIQYTIV